MRFRATEGEARVWGRAVHLVFSIPIVSALAACGGGGGGSSSTTPTPAPTYTIGGSISGLTNEGLILANGTDTDTPVTGDQSFVFPTAVVAGTSYSVTVQLQPDALMCTVANGTGVIGSANVTDVEVTCAPSTFTVGGTISGLTSSGLVLANGAETVAPTAGATTFVFPTPVPTAGSFDVTVKTQPSGQTCQVSNGVGVILTSSVNNVSVTCT